MTTALQRIQQLEQELADVRRAANAMADTMTMGLLLLEPAERLMPDGPAAGLARLIRVDLLQYELVSGDPVPA